MSVDPLAQERSWLTPYNFVSNNPVLRVDPTGMLDENNGGIYVTGEGADDYVEQLQSRTKMTVIRNQETGRVTFEGKARNKFDKALVSASTSEEYSLRIETTETEGSVFFGGGFMGASQNSETGILEVNYLVNTNVTGAIDQVTKRKGLGVGHETIEGYLIGEYMTKNGITSTPPSTIKNPNLIFEEAHKGTRNYRVDQESSFSVGEPTWPGSNWFKVLARGKVHEINSVTGDVRN